MKLNTNFRILFVFTIINNFVILNTFATTSDYQKVEQQQLIIQQQQEQQRKQELNQQKIDETERIRKTREGLENSNILEEKNSELVDKNGACKYIFKKIYLKGNKVFSTKKLKSKILEKYLGKCIDKVNIEKIQNELMKFYIDNGYTNSRIYFDFSKDNYEAIKDGIFNIIIDEGKVKDIKIIDTKYNDKLSEKMKKDKNVKESFFHSFRMKSQEFFAFPFLKGKEFNLRDYEQGLDQINRLESNNATIDIKPVDSKNAEDEGYSNVIINNNKSFPINLNFGTDNSGNKNTGERRGYMGFNIDNLLSMDDNLYLKYTQDLDWENNLRYNKIFYESFSIPFGYWTFSNSLNYSKYLTTIKGYNTSYHTSGNTLTQTYDIDRVIFRRRLFKINTGAELTLQDTESFVKGLKNEVGTRRSTNINLYFNNIIYTKLGTIIIKPSFEKGLRWFNPKIDDNDLSNTTGRNQYELVKLYTYYNTKINLPLFTKTNAKNNDGSNVIQKIQQKDKDGNILKDKDGNDITKDEPLIVRNKLPINYTLTFNGQYSYDTLYGTNQFSVGGEWTVRGFRENTISGDNGYNIRNDLRVNVEDLFPNCLTDLDFMNFGSTIHNKQYNLSINDALSRSYLSIFYDYGYVDNKHGDSDDVEYNAKSGYMAGTGLSLNYYGKYLNWSLTYAKALHSPEYLQTRDSLKKEEHSIYWMVNVAF